MIIDNENRDVRAATFCYDYDGHVECDYNNDEENYDGDFHDDDFSDNDDKMMVMMIMMMPTWPDINAATLGANKD